jgi:hypothetical protein
VSKYVTSLAPVLQLVERSWPTGQMRMTSPRWEELLGHSNSRCRLHVPSSLKAQKLLQAAAAASARIGEEKRACNLVIS